MNNFQYSPNFLGLIKNDTENTLVANSFVSKTDFKKWEGLRSFVANLINQDGKILDIGCANGFLLKCLMEWSDYELDPYGIDTENHLIEQARILFPDTKEQFIVGDFKTIPELVDDGVLPKNFSTVYWNVWDDWQFDTEEKIRPISDLIRILKKDGRLILGFYDTNEDNNFERIRRLEKLGYKVSEPVPSPTFGNTVLLTYIDKHHN